MADATDRNGSTMVPKIMLVLAVINLVILATGVAINVFGAMLPL